ncbi:dihydrofolate reductase family protein [Streptomyces sp. B6B3]|uniref:dihydrofolate reductase family protein n=1 Tax=Streptomyces sp. B6B3 TaxID=3153570 RepID=UPI00325D8683
MGRIVYSMFASLDGFVEDADGGIGFSAPDEELHRLANEQARQTAVFLFGRRMFEVMEEPWTVAARRDDVPEVEAEFARAYVDTPRVVFSDTLERVPEGVRLVRSADAVAEAERLKETTDGILSVGGPGLAASLFPLIDEFRLFVLPVLVGGGKPFFPQGRSLPLVLTDDRRFASGTMYLRYERRR